MRRLVLGLIAVLALPASAAAKGGTTTIAPPGNSGVSQYLETIPTAHGGQPTSSVHNHGGGSGNSRGSGGGPGGSGGGSGGAGSSSGASAGQVSALAGQGSAVSSSTQRALDAHGPNGRAAAAVLAATAPAVAMHHGSRAVVPVAPATSPASAVFKALTGSTASGGLGALLPIILIASLLGLTALALLRRRRTTT